MADKTNPVLASTRVWQHRRVLDFWGLISMDSNLLFKGKFTFRLGSRKVVMVKKTVESLRHVVMKALLWARYLPTYNRLQVEVPIGYKYTPDLVQNGPEDIQFWAEAGNVGSQKLRRVLKRFPRTHFALATWGGAGSQDCANTAPDPGGKPLGSDEKEKLTMNRLQPGDAAPAFSAMDQHGNTVNLVDLKGRKVFVFFYPKANTSG